MSKKGEILYMWYLCLMAQYINRTRINSPVGLIVKQDADVRGVVLSDPKDTAVFGVITGVQMTGHTRYVEVVNKGSVGVFIHNKFAAGDIVYLRKYFELGAPGTAYASSSPTVPYVRIGVVRETGVRSVARVDLDIAYVTTPAEVGGTVNYVAKFTATDTVGNSGITDDGTSVSTAENIKIASDSAKLFAGAGGDMTIWYDGTDGHVKTSDVAASDLVISCGTDKTLELETVVWDDLRITPGSFDRPGISDPVYVAYYPNGGGLGVYLPEFAKDDFASFTIQIPHSYKQGANIFVHAHWTPGDNGNEENGATVGWKVDYSWANINGNFGDMQTANLSDACDGTDHKHQMTPEVEITGTDKHISSMLMCNIRRSDTGTDDTWAGTASGALPLLLEVDFHVPLETLGSRTISVK